MDTSISLPRRQALFALLSAPWVGTASAQAPSGGGALRILVPAASGSVTDRVARQVAQGLAAERGQAVVVENREGAGGATAAREAMQAPADGRTLLWALSSMAGLPFVQRTPPYQDLAELEPVAGVMRIGYALFAHTEVPEAGYPELVAYGRANPGMVTYGTGNLLEQMMGTHLFGQSRMNVRRVPFANGNQLLSELLKGHVQLAFAPVANGVPHVTSGMLRPLLVLTPRRNPLVPEAPTLGELGLSAGRLPSWNALFAPRGTPREVLETLSAQVQRAVARADTQTLIADVGAVPDAEAPPELAGAVRQATEAWRDFAREQALAPA